MASGLPVIVSKTAGASEILIHGENALIVDPK
ncbi:MAG: glycosyltransferase, partial [Patescibacteria group bacterium]